MISHFDRVERAKAIVSNRILMKPQGQFTSMPSSSGESTFHHETA